jgi:hypothetical protein
MEKQSLARGEAARSRALRLKRASLMAEQADAIRLAEDRIASEQHERSESFRPRLRDLDLKILALSAQRGSPAAGPPEVVEAALKEARAEKRRLESSLAAELTSIRNARIAEVREKLEAREADLERSLAIEDAQRTYDAGVALSRYREALASAARSLPRDEGRGGRGEMRHPDTVQAQFIRPDAVWNPPRRVSQPKPERWPDTRQMVRSIIYADLRAHVRRIAVQRGWRVVFERMAGAPDRTADIQRILTEERFLR